MIQVSALEAVYLAETKISNEDFAAMKAKLVEIMSRGLNLMTITYQILILERQHEEIHQVIIQRIKANEAYDDLEHELMLNDLLLDFIEFEEIRLSAVKHKEHYPSSTNRHILTYRLLEEINKEINKAKEA